MSSDRAVLIPDGGLTRRAFLRLTGAAVGAVTLPGLPALDASAAAGKSRRGGALRLGATTDATSFEPYAISDNASIWTMLLIYDQLTRPTPDGLHIIPNLARSWDISRDGKTYTFHLQKGVKFHDGSPLTAEDVKFAVERAAFAKNTQWAFILKALKSMEVVDPHTIRAHLHQPHAPFLADLALFATSVFPKKLYEQMGKKLWQHPIGSGPFRFHSWEHGSQITLLRNPHWWKNPQQPYVDSFHNVVVPDTNTRLLQVQTGELEIALFISPAQALTVRHSSSVILHLDKFFDSFCATLNLRKPPLDNKLVRQALNYGVDKESIVKHILFGFGKPMGQALPEMFGYDQSLRQYPYDPAKAKRLLKAAGHPHGFELKMLLDSSMETEREVATLMQAQLKKIGVNLTIRPMEEATWYTTVQNPPNNYETTISYLSSDIIDPDEMVGFAISGNTGSDAFWTFYNNPKVNSLARQASAESNPAKRLRLYYEIDRLHRDDAPMIFLYQTPSITITAPRVQGFMVQPTGAYRVEEVWLK